MISRDLIDRMKAMLKKMPVREDFLEKYFKKLKSEGEIQDYKVLGISNKMSRFVVESKFKSDWYRMGIDFSDDGKKYTNLQIVNHDPYEYTDVFSENI